MILSMTMMMIKEDRIRRRRGNRMRMMKRRSGNRGRGSATGVLVRGGRTRSDDVAHPHQSFTVLFFSGRMDERGGAFKSRSRRRRRMMMLLMMMIRCRPP
jgi:hypothetical protein